MVTPYDFCSCSRTASPEKDTTTSVVIIHPFKNGIILSIVVDGQAVFAGFEPQNDRFRSGQSSCPLNRRTILRPAAVLTRLEVRPGATGLYFDPAHHASPGSAPFRARTPQRADSGAITSQSMG